jgi:hypothetical protein
MMARATLVGQEMDQARLKLRPREEIVQARAGWSELEMAQYISFSQDTFFENTVPDTIS